MTNKKAPERVWINSLPESGRVTAYVSPIREVGSGRSLSLAEYVRADLLATKVKEEREAAFTAIGVELRRYGANIRKVDLMERFQQLFRELQVND